MYFVARDVISADGSSHHTVFNAIGMRLPVPQRQGTNRAFERNNDASRVDVSNVTSYFEISRTNETRMVRPE